MISTSPVESYADIEARFPGIANLEPQALGRLAFHAYAHPADPWQFEDSGDYFEARWTDRVLRILDETKHPSAERSSRLDYANSVRYQRQLELDTEKLLTDLEATDALDGLEAALQFLEDRDFKLVEKKVPGPITPEGREVRISLRDKLEPGSLVVRVGFEPRIEDSDGNEADEKIVNFIHGGAYEKYSIEQARSAIESIEPISTQEIDAKRAVYGTKAANLLLLDDRIAKIRTSLVEDIPFSIPPFIAVSTDVYVAWRDQDVELFESMIDGIMQEVGSILDTDDETHPLVAIRSSAVYSEDGESVSGAGIYESALADPFDSASLRDAVEKVFKSVDSDSAVSYREANGIVTELMGLVIQTYVESEGSWRGEAFFGHANSKGANPNLVDLQTNVGELLYDKQRITGSLLFEKRDDKTKGATLHTHPDFDSKLRDASIAVSAVPHAAILAEKLFGKPMQVEFVNNNVVQVRPLGKIEENSGIVFPDLPALAELAGNGVGDLTLDVLPEDEDNSQRTGLVVFYNEYGYTIRDSYSSIMHGYSLGDDVLPKEGAVLIMKPSSSGHIQSLCRERGLVCIYPNLGDKDIGATLVRLRELSEGSQRIRVVSDGYRSRIYTEPKA